MSTAGVVLMIVGCAVGGLLCGYLAQTPARLAKRRFPEIIARLGVDTSNVPMKYQGFDLDADPDWPRVGLGGPDTSLEAQAIVLAHPGTSLAPGPSLREFSLDGAELDRFFLTRLASPAVGELLRHSSMILDDLRRFATQWGRRLESAEFSDAGAAVHFKKGVGSSGFRYLPPDQFEQILPELAHLLRSVQAFCPARPPDSE